MQIKKCLAKVWDKIGVVPVIDSGDGWVTVLDCNFLRETWFKNGVHPQSFNFNGFNCLKINKCYIIKEELSSLEENLY